MLLTRKTNYLKTFHLLILLTLTTASYAFPTHFFYWPSKISNTKYINKNWPTLIWRLLQHQALRKRLKVWTTCSIKMSLAGQTWQTLSCQPLLEQILTTLERDLDTAISISSAPLLSLGEPNLISMGSSSCCWLFRLFATAWIDRIHSFLTQKTHTTALKICLAACVLYSQPTLTTFQLKWNK